MNGRPGLKEVAACCGRGVNYTMLSLIAEGFAHVTSSSSRGFTASGRYDYLRDVVFDCALILDVC